MPNACLPHRSKYVLTISQLPEPRMKRLTRIEGVVYDAVVRKYGELSGIESAETCRQARMLWRAVRA